MKINTKKCMPIKGSSLTNEEAMIHPNKYILTLTDPSASNNDNDRDEEHDDTNREVGRQVKYLPNMVYTPVLTSTRKAKESRRLVSDDDIEELNRNLAAKLSIGDEKDGSNSEAEDGTALSDHGKHREIEEKPLGRYITSLFSYKTCETSNVKRSARIFAKGQQPKINPVA